jgi:hypothetical protein
MNDDEEIIENEIALQRPAVRKDASAVRALLDPDFVEVITTGKAFDREEVIEALAGQTGYVQTEVTNLQVASLSPTVRLLTYTDESRYHSSVWVQASPGVWLLRFHQQTSITASAV